MKTLFLKTQFFDLLENGKKKSTIRKNFKGKISEEILFLCGKRKKTVKITNIREIKIEEINDEIAKKEGFKNKDELLKVISDLYKNINNFILIEFE